MRIRSLPALAVLSSVLLIGAGLGPWGSPAAAVPATPAAAGSVPVPPAATLAALNYAPTGRSLHPVAVRSTLGTVNAPQNVLSGADTRLSGAGSGVVLDFGKEVGGLVTLAFHATSDAGQQVGLAFSESSLYTGTSSDASNGGSGADGALTAAAPAQGSYTMPAASLRGGFRYLTIFMRSSGWVDLSGATLQYSPAPDLSNPSAYPNYFYSDDDLLNRIWYAGAYTVQTNTIAPNQGRVWGPPASGWNNGATVGVGTSVLVDGAKRDRTVWPGDLGVSIPTAFVSTDDLNSVKNALQTMYNAQQASGELPFAGPQVSFYGSDTYHLSTLIGTGLYYRYSQNKAWLDSIWAKYTLGLSFIIAKIDSSNLLNVTGTADWARSGQGGENIEANAMMYGALTDAASLATLEGDSSLAANWAARAAALKTAANTLLWEPAVGLYRDNPSSTVEPQDGNSLAVQYGLTATRAQNTAIAGNLGRRWNSFGAPTPEKGGNIATFPGSMEVQAHFAADDDQRGLDLIRREWGYMLNSPLGTGSTFWEGFKADGSFDYNGSYMSLAHGWGTGPTSALTFDVLGLSPSTTSGYRFVPHPGDLRSVQGRITLPAGALDAAWSRNVAAGTFTAQFSSPAGAVGVIGVPKLGGSDVQVSMDGALVWSRGQFSAHPGIGGASQDSDYIYLTGVSATSGTVTATGVAVPAELPAGYTRCGGEGATCTVTGTRTVAYGAGSYVYRSVTGSTACTSTVFGTDPAVGVQKSCYVAPAGGPSGYTSCAAENTTCTASIPARIAYGADGAFTYKLATGAISCSTSTFGNDPAPGVLKQCYLPPAGGPTGGWTACAAEAGTCTAQPGQPVAYGAGGAFAYTPAAGTTACNNTVFGDPVPGVAKSCYVRVGAPSGYSSVCAAENTSCTITAARTIAYGASGRYVYRFVTANIPCTSAAFGEDPIFGAAKSCYSTP